MYKIHNYWKQLIINVYKLCFVFTKSLLKGLLKRRQYLNQLTNVCERVAKVLHFCLAISQFVTQFKS
jgi:hypothetical protein